MKLKEKKKRKKKRKKIAYGGEREKGGIGEETNIVD